jgi:hypothetical protein
MVQPQGSPVALRELFVRLSRRDDENMSWYSDPRRL